jgi:hypothetical protein
MSKFEIKSHWTGKLIFECELGAEFEQSSESVKMGAAVRLAVKSGANLSDAYLSGANLSGANLSDAKDVPDFTMPDGLLFSEYLRDVVPALLTAGGKTIKEIINGGAWDCHSWDNCPMAMAFGVHRVEDVPPLYRARAQEFVRFFDARMIPAPVIESESAA